MKKNIFTLVSGILILNVSLFAQNAQPASEAESETQAESLNVNGNSSEVENQISAEKENQPENTATAETENQIQNDAADKVTDNVTDEVSDGVEDGSSAELEDEADVVSAFDDEDFGNEENDEIVTAYNEALKEEKPRYEYTKEKQVAAKKRPLKQKSENAVLDKSENYEEDSRAVFKYGLESQISSLIDEEVIRYHTEFQRGATAKE